jgi:ABC-2 type transport system permease protein
MSFLIGYLSSINKDEATKIAVRPGNIVKRSLKKSDKTAYTVYLRLPFNAAKDTASKGVMKVLCLFRQQLLQRLKIESGF